MWGVMLIGMHLLMANIVGAQAGALAKADADAQEQTMSQVPCEFVLGGQNEPAYHLDPELDTFPHRLLEIVMKFRPVPNANHERLAHRTKQLYGEAAVQDKIIYDDSGAVNEGQPVLNVCRVVFVGEKPIKKNVTIAPILEDDDSDQALVVLEKNKWLLALLAVAWIPMAAAIILHLIVRFKEYRNATSKHAIATFKKAYEARARLNGKRVCTCQTV